LGSKSARAAHAERPAPLPPIPDWRFDPPLEATRDAVWSLAGPRREAEPLQTLRSDPYPLARMIATSALERRESRGAHLRVDYPLPDAGMDGIHLLVGADCSVRTERWH